MDTAGSVSKGCFAFKGKKKVAKVEDYLQEGNNAGHCYSSFLKMWNEIDIQIQILQSDLNSKIFDDLLNFATRSCDGYNPEKECKQTREIPTAALVTGVNTPDHSVMFANLTAMLKERVTPLVAILKSKDCPNIKSTLGKALGQLMDGTQEVLFDEDEEEEHTTNVKNLPLTLSTLAKWYSQKYLVQPSSPKKRKSTDCKAIPARPPSIVVVFEDFERFAPKVVQDFILIAGNYIAALPLVFVFGIATSVSAVHRLLPNQVSSLLCMEKFQAPPSSQYLSMVIEQILMTSNFPFKLGSKVFQLLLDIFLYHDFSVLNFIRGLRFSMLDHYCLQPLSFLCCSPPDISQLVKSMRSDTVEQLRRLPSFMKYVESCSPAEQPDLLLKDSFTKDRVSHLLTSIHEYHNKFFPVLRCLHSLVSPLPGYPLGKQIREVYSVVLESNVFEHESYPKSLELLRIMSKDELQTLVQTCADILVSSGDTFSDVTAAIQDLLGKFETLDAVVEEEEQEEEDVDRRTSLPSKTSLHQLRQQLQDISKRKKKLSPYEKLRLEIVDFFDLQFRTYLVCPKTLPLHEIFYYDRASSVRRHLNGSPRSALQMALSNPHHYLQCKCCETGTGQVIASMPDLCIVYKLHLECSQMINLYDWMQAFITIVQGDEEVEDKDEQTSKQLQARFIQAVSELQFLGFVKPTKRKTDHVARLTWGGC